MRHLNVGRRVVAWFLLLSLMLAFLGCGGGCAARSAADPPAPLYEYRGAWVATANNLDWPSQRGLTVAQQKEEIRQMLNVAKALKFNVIYLQVRAAGNRIYAQNKPGFEEPWSRSVTTDGLLGGTMPADYDPLQEWITGCHARGIELHAWVNPFRANARKPAADPPKWVKYGKEAWFDPGSKPTQQWTRHLIRYLFGADTYVAASGYDIDGLGVDHYAYPDPQPDTPTTQTTQSSRPPPYLSAAAELDDMPHPRTIKDFPDDASYHDDNNGQGLKKKAWRRKNVNDFMEMLHRLVNSVEVTDSYHPQPKFTISPMAVNNPKPEPEDGPYGGRYEEPKKWLANGWCDIMVPEVYYKTDDAKHPFRDTLEDWTKAENPKHALIVAGLNTTRVADADDPWSNAEIAEQIRISRDLKTSGHLHYSLRTLAQRPDLVGYLKNTVYQQAALVPGGDTKSKPAKPGNLKVTRDGKGSVQSVEWPEQPEQKAKLRGFIVYYKIGGHWRSEIVPADYSIWKNRLRIQASGKNLGKAVTDVRVAAVRKDGVESERVKGQ
jgi:uncharacterized lipoprotein YddW (UPF0748 family)